MLRSVCVSLPQEAAQHRASTDAALRSAGAEAELQQSIDRDLADAMAELAAATQRDEGDSGDASGTVTELSVCPTHTPQVHCQARLGTLRSAERALTTCSLPGFAQRVSGGMMAWVCEDL